MASAVVGEGSASAPSPVPTAGHFEMPPLDVPDGVGPTATTHYESLARSVPEIHRRLDAVEAALRDLCQPKTPRCDGSFKDLAKELGEIDDAIRRLPPRCQGSSEVAKAFDERLTRHLELLRDRRRAIDDQTATDLDDEAEARWKKLLADEAVPQPCLRFSCEDW